MLRACQNWIDFLFLILIHFIHDLWSVWIISVVYVRDLDFFYWVLLVETARIIGKREITCAYILKVRNP